MTAMGSQPMVSLLNRTYEIIHVHDGFLYFIYIVYTMYLLFGLKTRRKLWQYLCCSSVLYLTVYYGLPALGLVKEPYPYIFVFIVLISASIPCAAVFLREAFLPKLLYLLFYYTFIRGMRFAWGFHYSREAAMDAGRFRVLDTFVLFSTFMILVIFTRLFRKHPIIGLRRMEKKDALITLILPVSFFLIFLLWDPQIPVSELAGTSISSVLLLLCLSAVYLLYSHIVEGYEKRMQMDKALNETRAELMHIRYSAYLQEEIRKERHELKNRYFYIRSLMRDERYEDVNRYLDTTVGEKLEEISALSTGNTLIDYLLNEKIAAARKRGIRIYTEVTVPDKLKVNEDALCTILLNLLDNAIEAGEKETDPDIQITIRIVREYLCVKVSNKTSADILKENPDFATTKEDRKNHGLGMRIIRETVDQQDGIFQCQMEDNYFAATVMLPLQQQ